MFTSSQREQLLWNPSWPLYMLTYGFSSVWLMVFIMQLVFPGLTGCGKHIFQEIILCTRLWCTELNYLQEYESFQLGTLTVLRVILCHIDGGLFIIRTFKNFFRFILVLLGLHLVVDVRVWDEMKGFLPPTLTIFFMDGNQMMNSLSCWLWTVTYLKSSNELCSAWTTASI